MEKRFIALIILLLLLGASCSNDKDKPDAYGSFEATEITVSALANGKIMLFNIEEGQLLDSNQMIGFIDTTDLHLKKLQTIGQKEVTMSRREDLESQIAVQEQNRDNILIEKKRVINLLKDGAATTKHHFA